VIVMLQWWRHRSSAAILEIMMCHWLRFEVFLGGESLGLALSGWFRS
jgi:hypothetical protein